MSDGLFIASSQALVAGLLALAKPGRLQLLTGFNNDAATVYVQIFDTATGPAPGDVPVYSMLVPPMGTYSWAPGQNGRQFAHGIFVASSVAPDVFALGPASLWIDVEGNAA